MPTNKSFFGIKARPLTTSEKVLLTLLSIALIAYLGNRFVLTPQAEKMEALEVEKSDLNLKIMEMNATLRREPEIKKEYEELKVEREEILANYFPTLDQTQIIYLLNDMLPMDEVDIATLNFSRPATENMNSIDVRNMAISVPFSGPYENIVELVKSIETSPRRMMVDSITLD